MTRSETAVAARKADGVRDEGGREVPVQRQQAPSNSAAGLSALMSAGGNQQMVQLSSGHGGGAAVVQAKLEAAGSASDAATPAPASGGGERLPAPVQAKMEGAFGADFSGVRVNVGPQAPAIGAQAYAQGDQLQFAPGRYQPDTAAGQELIGHELTHVVQQRQGRVAAPAQGKGGRINSDAGLEAEADRMGAMAARGERVPMQGGAQRGSAAGGPVQGKFTWKKGAEEEAEPPTDASSIAEWLGTQGVPISALKHETLADFLTHPETFEFTFDSAGAQQIAALVNTEYIGQAGYMTGDMYGLCAALLLDPGLHLNIFVDSGGYYRGQYESSARKYNQTLEEFYKATHNKDYDAGELDGRLRKTAEGMIAFYESSGVKKSRIHVIECADAQLEYAKQHKAPANRPFALPALDRSAPKDPQHKEAHHGTETVAAHLEADAEGASEILRSAWLGPVTEEDKLAIGEYYKRTFEGAGRVALLWGRISGRTPGGAHPELDSNMVVMGQLTGLLKRDFPGTTVALIGDEVMPPGLLSAVGKTHLVKFWRDLPNGSNRHNQLYFLDLLRQHNGAVALGMRSGAMEGPAMLGMPTIYIDDADCDFLPTGEREGAGRRMELLAGDGATERTQAPERTEEIEAEKKGPLPDYKRLQTEKLLGQISQYVGEMDELLADARAGTPGRWGQIRALIASPADLEKQKLDKTMTKLRQKHYRISASQLAEHTHLVSTAKTHAKQKVYTRAEPALTAKLVADARYQWRDVGGKTVNDRTTANTYLQFMTQRLKDVGPPDGADAKLVYDRFMPALDAIELGSGELEQVARLLEGFGLERK